MPSRAHRYATENSLTDPVEPKGKQKVVRAREELWAQVDMYLRQIEAECVNGVNLLARIRKESSFVRLDKRKPSWSTLGALQGNADGHIDALCGVVYGLYIAIELLDEVLGDPSIEGRKTNNGKDQDTQEGTAKRDAEEPATDAAGSRRRAPARKQQSKRS